MELVVYNIDGTQTTKSVSLNDEIFGIEPNDHAIYMDVKHYLANQRQGTHKTKGRSEVKGSTRKLHRQKGTGGSRKGDIKNPLYRGGGTAFGPQPRDYSFKINKKVKRLARKSALSYKAKANSILVLESFNIEPKTKNYVEILKKFNLLDKKSLLVLPAVDHSIILSSRNLPKAKVVSASDLNTYAVLDADQMILLVDSLPTLENILLD